MNLFELAGIKPTQVPVKKKVKVVNGGSAEGFLHSLIDAPSAGRWSPPMRQTPKGKWVVEFSAQLKQQYDSKNEAQKAIVEWRLRQLGPEKVGQALNATLIVHEITCSNCGCVIDAPQGIYIDYSLPFGKNTRQWVKTTSIPKDLRTTTKVLKGQVPRCTNCWG